MNTFLRSLLLFSLTVCISTVYGQIYNYTSDTSGTYNSIATNATGVKLTRYNGLTKPSSPCGTGFSVGTFVVADSTYTGANKAVEADVTAASGYQLSVTGFSVGLRRSNTGPAKAMLAYSTDGGTTWIDKGSEDAPNNASCGTTTTATWTTSLTVPSTSTLKFRVYLYHASNTGGTAQILNLLINGTVVSTAAPVDSIFTSAASFGPFCQGTAGAVSVPFTTSGTFTDPFYVQLSNASGVFPADATSNLISTGTTSSPATASIPSSTAAGTGYRVRVVNQTPLYFTSGDNGSNIVVNAPQATSVYDTICPGAGISFGGTTYTASGTYVDQEQGVNSCDSTITHYLTVLDTKRDTVNASICQGNSFPFNGTTYTAAGSYSDTIRCDSIVTLVISYKTVLRDTVSALICAGDSYSFGGTSYTTAGTYSDTVRCDSISTLVLGIKTVSRDTITASICQGSSYSFGSTSYTTAGTYSDTVRCDSISTLVLSYKTILRDTVNASVCQGTSYPFNGTTYTTAGSYNDTVRCDSVVTLVLSYKTTLRDTVHASVCQGTGYPFNGTTYTTSGSYNDTVRCDSIVTLVLSYKTVLRDTVHASVCQGTGYPFNGTTYTTAGSYSDTVRCDSIVTLVLSYKTVLRDTVHASVCRGTGYPFNGTTYTTAGSYSDTVRCDSIVTLVLSYKTLHRDTVSAGVCPGDSYTFHGASYSAAGTYSDTLSCDSIVTLNLSINTAPTAVATLTGTDQLSTTAFSTYQWLLNGAAITGATSQNYIATQNGNYSVVVTNASGCTDTSNVIAVVLTGIAEHNTLNARIYPNPTESIINIDADGVRSVEVVDLIGRPMFTVPASKISSHTQVDLSNYATGVYILIIRGANNSVTIQNVVRK